MKKNRATLKSYIAPIAPNLANTQNISYGETMLRRIVILFAILLAFLIPTQTFGAFTDIKNSPYRHAIEYLEEQGIVNGNIFEPRALITKGEFVTWLLRLESFNADTYTPKTTVSFTDVPKDHRLFPFVGFLVDSGSVAPPGKESSFGINRSINRLSALRLIFEVKGIPVSKVVNEESWYIENLSSRSRSAPYVQKALELEMFSATTTKIQPYSKLTRQEAAYFLAQADRKTSSADNTVTIITGDAQNHEVTEHPTFQLLLNAWDTVNRDYYKQDEIEKQKLLYGAIEGMVETLEDPYSQFLPPSENTLTAELEGEIEGIGAVVEARDGFIVIVSPLKQSPAEKAGLLPGDIIFSADGIELKNKPITEAVKHIKGPAGSEVALVIQRGEETLTFNVVRGVIELRSVEISFTEDNIAIITMNSFNAKTHFEFITAVGEVSKQKPNGIVLDLRNNPGGFLDTAVQVAGYFIEKGKTVAHIKFPDHIETEKSDGSGVLGKYPVVVLVNEGSASASEILAGALKDHRIAKIIGEKTFGKGTVQEFITYSDGSALKITIAQWLTPEQHLIQDNGIAPDIEVVLSKEDRTLRRDPQLARALDELR